MELTHHNTGCRSSKFHHDRTRAVGGGRCGRVGSFASGTRDVDQRIHGVLERGSDRFHLTRITTTQFPQPPGMGATWDPALVVQAAAVEGYEARFITQTKRYNRQILMLLGGLRPIWRALRGGGASKRCVAKTRSSTERWLSRLFTDCRATIQNTGRLHR